MNWIIYHKSLVSKLLLVFCFYIYGIKEYVKYILHIPSLLYGHEQITFCNSIKSRQGLRKFIHSTKATSYMYLFVNSCVQFWREGQI